MQGSCVQVSRVCRAFLFLQCYNDICSPRVYVRKRARVAYFVYEPYGSQLCPFSARTGSTLRYVLLIRPTAYTFHNGPGSRDPHASTLVADLDSECPFTVSATMGCSTSVVTT